MRARVDAMLDEYRAMRSRLHDVAAELAALTATARAADRCVTVTVSAHGELADLRIDPVLAARLDAKTLAARILEASRKATAEVRQRVGARMRDVLPEGLRPLIGPEGTVDLVNLLPAHPAAPDALERSGRS